jgi:hypothetical protein
MMWRGEMVPAVFAAPCQIKARRNLRLGVSPQFPGGGFQPSPVRSIFLKDF